MKHQIALVGGQLLPIYVGIKEFSPDKIHFIVSKESIESLTNLKPMISSIFQSDYRCNAFDFYEIKSVCEKIIEKINPEDTITFNLTGGTKIMVLACQAIIHEKGLNGFYINQDDSFLVLPSYERKSISTEISAKEFFDISGHSTYNYKTINDFTEADVKTAEKIKNFANNDSRYKLVIGTFRRKYFNKNDSLPSKGVELINNNLKVIWDQTSINIEFNNKNILILNSKIVQDLLFKAVWWELMVAKEIAKTKNYKELFLSFELTFKFDKQVSKNEIDILINTGKKLIFIECKSGLVKQEDINKMKIVKQTYGGVIAKSILVCLEMPSQTIIEKCKELDIALFYSNAFGRIVSPLSNLPKFINEFIKSDSLN